MNYMCRIQKVFLHRLFKLHLQDTQDDGVPFKAIYTILVPTLIGSVVLNKLYLVEHGIPVNMMMSNATRFGTTCWSAVKLRKIYLKTA